MPKPAVAAAIAAAVLIATTAAAAAMPLPGGGGGTPPPADRLAGGQGTLGHVVAGLRARQERAARNARAARVAMRNLGAPYAWGGASPAGFDCSGLAAYAFGKAGTRLPHSTYAIWGALPKVPRARLRPGDMVFFDGLGHMGIYVGRGRYVHAPRSGEVVEVERLSARDDYLGAVRA